MRYNVDKKRKMWYIISALLLFCVVMPPLRSVGFFLIVILVLYIFCVAGILLFPGTPLLEPLLGMSVILAFIFLIVGTLLS